MSTHHAMNYSDGYRPNVGIILANRQGRVLWARRIGQKAWQFPQGGIDLDESPEQALYRELAEEVGLQPAHVRILGSTRGWLRYQLPENLIRHDRSPLYIGQKQMWFLLRLVGGDDAVKLDLSAKPEFDRWRWVHYWQPLQEVVAFKREVYEQALSELAPLLFPGGAPPGPPPGTPQSPQQSHTARPSAKTG
jgi:putative (di)nucleoside polyphosphate hydrolase